jgi:hypothetical protein
MFTVSEDTRPHEKGFFTLRTGTVQIKISVVALAAQLLE